MKEMLFITVAILIPPSLTFLGYVGGGSAGTGHEWQAASTSHAAALDTRRELNEPAALRTAL